MGKLERRLGLFSIITISISSMIGDGIFILPTIGFATTGPSLYLSFLFASLCILPAAMSKAELATAMPTSGGTYVYIERTFGPLAGTVSGLGLFLSILLKASVSLVGIGLYFTVLSSFPTLPTILTFLVIITLLNIFGVGKVSSLVTAILFISLVTIGTLSLLSGLHIEPAYLQPLLPNGWEGLASATGLVFVSYAGVTKVAAIAEEVKDPEKNLPKGILYSLFLVTILYCTVSFILAANYPVSELINQDVPILYKLAEDRGGQIFATILAVVAILTMVNTSNAGILAGSRFPFAMSRDHLFPSFLGKLHKKFLTPVTSIIVSGILIALTLIFLDVVKIAKLASAFMILIYIIENIAVVVLRETRAQWYKPGYKAPFYPILQIFGILSGVALLFAMGKLALIAILSIAIPGILLFVLYSRKRTSRKGVIGIRGKRKDLIESYPFEQVGFSNFDVTTRADVVVGLFGREKSAEMLVEMGLSMAQHTNVEVVSIIEIPEQTDLHDMLEEPAELRSLRRRIIAMANEKDESITFDPIVSHDVSKTVFEISQGLQCNWMVIEWGGRSRGSLTFHNPIGWLKSHLHCNLATFRDAGVRYIRKIMVVINNDKHDKLVLTTAEHLSKIYWADVTLVRFAHESDSEEKKFYEQSFLKELAKKISENTQTKLVIGQDKLSSLVAETCEYDLLILGSTDHTLLNSVRGTFDDKLIAKAACSVLAVHESSFVSQ
jgi:amino acid transporter